MEERREALLPDQKQYKEDDGKKKLGEERKKGSLALEKKLHTKMKTEKKKEGRKTSHLKKRELNRTEKMIKRKKMLNTARK